MKHVIVVMFFVALFLGCHESNSVEPIINSSDQLDKISKSNELIFDLPQKDKESKEVDFQYNYNFNPDKGCGSVIGETSLEYTIDKEAHGQFFYRSLKDVEIAVFSTMLINNKPIKTKYIYKLNRIEKVTKTGKIISGTTWGTFKMFSVGKYYNNVEIFRGEFTGDILLKTATLKLSGKGVWGSYRDRYLSAVEKQVCNSSNGSLKCLISTVKGKISPRVVSDN